MRVKLLAVIGAVAVVLVLLVTACSATTGNATSTNTSASASNTACPPTGGGVSGQNIGPIHDRVTVPGGAQRLVTRSEAHAEAAAAGMPTDTREKQYQEFFCEHLGIRVGYASPVLMAYAQHAGVPQATTYANQVVWISTSNPVYVVAGIQAGDSLKATSVRLDATTVRLTRSGIVLTKHQVGANDWWIGGPWNGAAVVLKVAAGGDTIQEVGIAIWVLASGRMAAAFMAGTFY
jgi:hypothetical protein